MEGDSFIVIENYKWEHILPGYSDGSDNVHVVNVLDDNGSVVGTIKQSAWERTLNIVSSLDEIPQVNRIDIPLEDNQFIKGTSGRDYIISWFFDPSFMNITIDAGAGDDHISSDDVTVSINGGAGNDILLGGTGNDSLNGGDGADTLSGGKGNDTFTGGNCADVFIYTGGKDVIQDYSEEDKISITGTADISTSGSNVIFTVGTGKITVKNAADKIISHVDAEDEHIYPTATDVRINGKTITLTESYMEDNFDLKNYDSTLQTVDEFNTTSLSRAINLPTAFSVPRRTTLSTWRGQ